MVNQSREDGSYTRILGIPCVSDTALAAIQFHIGTFDHAETRPLSSSYQLQKAIRVQKLHLPRAKCFFCKFGMSHHSCRGSTTGKGLAATAGSVPLV